MQRELHPVTQVGKSIPYASRLVLVNEDREASGTEMRGIRQRVEPVHHVALHDEWQREFRHELCDPCTARDHQPGRVVAAVASARADEAARPLGPALDRLAELELGAVFTRQGEMR